MTTVTTVRTLSIVLVSPPLCEPRIPNLGIEVLAGLARRQGHQVETFHGALLQSRYFQDELVHGLAAQACFTPLYFDLDRDEFAEELCAALFADFPPADRTAATDHEVVVDTFYFGMLEAEHTVERLLERIPPGADVIGLSVGFDAQKVPAAVLARRLRQRGETATIVVGGTGTDEEMGPALLERFPELDLVLQGEVDEAWPLLLERLSTGTAYDDVPGLVYRQGRTVISVPERPFNRAFLGTTVPDYSSFITQRAQSDYAQGSLSLLVETSRGCWWGKKHHCTFCGIRSVDQEYRDRDPEDTARLLTELYDRYQPDLLYCTDAIAPATAHATTWPALYQARTEGRDWQIFYETKSNLKRREIARMAAAGILSVQPGIESFCTRSLASMDKGATGLQQVAYLKWAHAYGVTVTYGIICGMPPERPADLREMTVLLRKLWHLPPAHDVNRLVLHRFSPHFREPQAHGLEDIRPFQTQHVIYQTQRPLLERLCYQRRFRVPAQETEEFDQARAELTMAVREWREAFLAGAGLWLRAEGDLRIVGRSRTGDDLTVEIVDDRVEVFVLDACDDRRSIPRLAQDSPVPIEALWRAAHALAERGLMIIEDDEALALPIPADADAVTDARWTSRQLIPLTVASR